MQIDGMMHISHILYVFIISVSMQEKEVYLCLRLKVSIKGGILSALAGLLKNLHRALSVKILCVLFYIKIIIILRLFAITSLDAVG